jgi:ATP-dependent Clp protease ATP-binding subunit ClpA
LRLGLLNRIDEMVALHELCKRDLAGIVEIQVGSLCKCLKSRGLDLELTPAAVSALADEGYDPAFGARLLKRVIQQRLENEISKRRLEGVFGEGDTVKVDFAGETFMFGKVAAGVGVKG